MDFEYNVHSTSNVHTLHLVIYHLTRSDDYSNILYYQVT